MAVLTKAAQPVDLRRQRQAGPLGTNRQQYRQAQRIRRVPRAGPVRDAAQSVVKTHRALCHRRAVSAAVIAVNPADRVLAGEK